MVLPERFELSTSPLPRECSTPELRQRRRVNSKDRKGLQAQIRVLQGFHRRYPSRRFLVQNKPLVVHRSKMTQNQHINVIYEQ